MTEATDVILIVEDETDLAAIIADYVRAAGYQAHCVSDGNAALAYFRAHAVALIVLDLMLPGLDGLAVCRDVRGSGSVPIIMVTARVEEIDRLLGLEAGADDYVCKPFSPRELVARIKAILRRTGSPRDARLPVTIDDATRTVVVRSRPVALTASEFALFAAMARRPGVIFPRAKLLDLACRDRYDVTDRAIDTHVKNLRRKLAVAAPDLELVHSVYGVGYRVEL